LAGDLQIKEQEIKDLKANEEKMKTANVTTASKSIQVGKP